MFALKMMIKMQQPFVRNIDMTRCEMDDEAKCAPTLYLVSGLDTYLFLICLLVI